MVPLHEVLAQGVVHGAQLRDFGVAFDVERAAGAAFDVETRFQYAAQQGDLGVGVDVGLERLRGRSPPRRRALRRRRSLG